MVVRLAGDRTRVVADSLRLRVANAGACDYVVEPKWDGFRALVSRNDHLRVRSRRGWDMSSLVPELAGLLCPR